jgi:lipoate-protein ligase B
MVPESTPYKRGADRPWLLLELPLTDYRAAQQLQVDCVAARQAGRLAQDLFILVEHPPVFTLGRNGGRENLSVADDFLQAQGVSLVAAERGGNITYHGPGQIVGYPIVDLNASRRGVATYVHDLEAVMERTAAAFGVAVQRDPRNSGVWADGCKLGSVGLCLRRGVSFHGFALNVNNDLTPFDWINPCGMSGVRMTSLAVLTGRTLSMPEVRRAVCGAMAQVMGIDWQPVTRRALKGLIGAPFTAPVREKA